MYLFFDTETNGKIKNFNLSLRKDTLHNFPRITQLGMALFGEDESLLGTKSFLIKPDDWTIPKEKFFIDNNMSTERCEEEGIGIKIALCDFLELIDNSKYLIAHNMDFDYPIIGAEMIRYGIKSERRLPKICTMQSTIDLCKLQPRIRGSYKYPKLEELHCFLFGTEMTETAHDALGDVLTTAKCFFELRKRGLYEPNSPWINYAG